MIRTRLFLPLVGLAMAAATTGTFGQDATATIGADEYTISCAVCHGADAKGDGEFARFLTVKPPNLTVLAKGNNGVFPFLKVFQTVDGRTMVGGHGTREMPIWGRRYGEEVGEKFGPYGGEIAVRARVLELVFYLQSIQQE